MTFYAENRGIALIDNNASGALEHGDVVHRELAISRTPSSQVIGVSYSQSEIVAYNPNENIDVRRVLIQLQLPRGKLFITGLSKLIVGALPKPGWKDNYAIIGGTGIYEGARGSEKLTLLEDGKTFKLELRIMK